MFEINLFFVTFKNRPKWQADGDKAVPQYDARSGFVNINFVHLFVAFISCAYLFIRSAHLYGIVQN